MAKKIETKENPAQIELFAEISPACTNTPTKIRSFNQYGLVNGLNYIFNEDGGVDWKKMIPKKFFVINRQKEDEIQKTLGKPIEEVSVDEVDEKNLLVLLGGFRYLAELRGYTKVDYSRPAIGPNGEVSVACSITWKGNYESCDEPVTFTGLGDATLNNTSPIGGIYYLTAIAENRSFIRSVRNFLRLEGILGRDELQSVKTITPKLTEAENAPFGAKPVDSLIQKCKLKGLTWMKLLELAEQNKENISSDISEWKTYKDIPSKDIYVLLGKIILIK